MNQDNELQRTQSYAPQTTQGSIESNRAIAEVQGQILMAKQFPRDQILARNNILEGCKRIRLAETALYSYPRGGTQITGPSIRLAEMIAQNWGNLDYGIIELEQTESVGKKHGSSVVMAYARDIQTNTRQQVVFTVPHARYSRAKGLTFLTDPRDIYEMIANQGARRLRKCILGVIPGDIVEEAVDACNKTLLGNNTEPLINRITKMVSYFAELGVTQEMIEKRIGHKMEATLPIEIVGLGKIFKSLQDGMSKIEDWFDINKTIKTDDLGKKKTEPKKKKKEQKKRSKVEEQPLTEAEIKEIEKQEHQEEEPPIEEPQPSDNKSEFDTLTKV